MRRRTLGETLRLIVLTTARERVAAARTQAFANLATAAAQTVDASLVTLAGIPDPDTAAALLKGLVTSSLGA